MMVCHSTTRAIIVCTFIVVAFVNLIILSVLQTHAHHKTESVLESFFTFHLHQNVSVFGHQNGLQNDKSVVQLTADRKERENVREETVRRGTESTKAAHVLTTQMKDRKRLLQRSRVRSDSGTAGLPAPTQPPQIRDCETWCRRGNDLKPPYKLTAVLLVRIYRKDLAELTSREMLQWMQYLRYAGFQHVYVYDAFVYKSESQLELLGPFIQSGYVTYVDWSARNPYTIQGTQVAAYQDCLNKFGSDSEWQAAIDIDEYPFSPSDLEQNFMERFIAKFSQENPHISEITMQNYLFLEKPLDHKSNPLLIDRIRRRTHNPANNLVKPIYRPLHLGAAQVHHNHVNRGGSMNSDERFLRMNHYWGARLQNWGENTPKILQMTQPDFSIRPIVEKLNGCSKCLGPDTLYTRRWN